MRSVYDVAAVDGQGAIKPDGKGSFDFVGACKIYH